MRKYTKDVTSPELVGKSPASRGDKQYIQYREFGFRKVRRTNTPHLEYRAADFLERATPPHASMPQETLPLLPEIMSCQAWIKVFGGE